jgi:putative spermidine/putrescine transport system substrate-binding protein
MDPRQSRIRRSMLIFVASLLLLTAACGGTAGTTPTPGGAGTDLVAQFPADVRPLLKGLPQEVVASLLKVRQAGSASLVIRMSAGELQGAMERAYRTNWEKITGWKIVQAGDIPTLAEVERQAKSGHPDWDIVEESTVKSDTLEKAGWLEKLDTNLLKSVLPKMPKGYPYTNYWLTYTQAAAILVYRTDRFPTSGAQPQKVADVFDKGRFPGKRCMYAYPQGGGTLEYALLADGVPVDQLYPLDAKRSFAKLSTIKKDLVFYSSGGQGIQFLVSGECDLGIIWNGRPAIRLRQDPSLPIAPAWEGSILTPGALSILKGAAHYDAAMSLFAYAWQPKNQCALLNDIGYGVPIDETCLNDFARKWSVTKDRIAKAFDQNSVYFAANIGALVDQFNAWRTSGG